MKKICTLLSLTFLFACERINIGVEEVVSVELPNATNLITVEGWLTSTQETQYVRLTRSNSFNSAEQVALIEDASVIVQSRSGQTFQYLYTANGIYLSAEQFSAASGTDYRVRVQLEDGREIRSEWETAPEIVVLNRLFIDSFEENDPDNPNQQIRVFFPRIIAIDPDGERNYYRWRFFKNDLPFTDFESITIQDDRFFDGNLIPNDFRSFGYASGDEMVVQFQSISSEAFNYLNLLKSQITSLGTSSGTTPAQVIGNLSFNADSEDETVLGYFGLVGVSADTAVVVN